MSEANTVDVIMAINIDAKTIPNLENLKSLLTDIKGLEHDINGISVPDIQSTLNNQRKKEIEEMMEVLNDIKLNINGSNDKLAKKIDEGTDDSISTMKSGVSSIDSKVDDVSDTVEETTEDIIENIRDMQLGIFNKVNELSLLFEDTLFTNATPLARKSFVASLDEDKSLKYAEDIMRITKQRGTQFDLDSMAEHLGLEPGATEEDVIDVLAERLREFGSASLRGGDKTVDSFYRELMSMSSKTTGANAGYTAEAFKRMSNAALVERRTTRRTLGLEKGGKVEGEGIGIYSDVGGMRKQFAQTNYGKIRFTNIMKILEEKVGKKIEDIGLDDKTLGALMQPGADIKKVLDKFMPTWQEDLDISKGKMIMTQAMPKEFYEFYFKKNEKILDGLNISSTLRERRNDVMLKFTEEVAKSLKDTFESQGREGLTTKLQELLPKWAPTEQGLSNVVDDVVRMLEKQKDIGKGKGRMVITEIKIDLEHYIEEIYKNTKDIEAGITMVKTLLPFKDIPQFKVGSDGEGISEEEKFSAENAIKANIDKVIGQVIDVKKMSEQHGDPDLKNMVKRILGYMESIAKDPGSTAPAGNTPSKPEKSIKKRT